MWLVVDRLQNDFGSFTVEDVIYEGRRARVLFSGPMHAAQSGLALDGKTKLLFDYNQLIREIAIDLKPRQILILGGGTMTLASALSYDLETAKIRVVEINKGLIDLAKDHFGYKPNHKIKVIIGDAYEYIQKTRTKYDLIITDIHETTSYWIQYYSWPIINESD